MWGWLAATRAKTLAGGDDCGILNFFLGGIIVTVGI